VDHPIQGMGGEDQIHRGFIGGIGVIKQGTLARDLPYPIHHRALAVAQIVQNDHIVTAVEQFHAGMAADVAGSACN